MKTSVIDPHRPLFGTPSEKLDNFLAALARLFVLKRASAEVAVLTLGRPIFDYTSVSPRQVYKVAFELDPSLYNQMIDCRETVEKSLSDASVQLFPNIWVLTIKIKPEPFWRETARWWLSGESSNQGRVRSDSVAPYEEAGLKFRSKSEVYLYRALKRRDVSFAPLPVFLRGGDNYRRREPDFVIYDRGQLLVLEVDGKQFHHETLAEADARLSFLKWEGAHVEHIESTQCDTAEKAETLVANSIMPLLKKLAGNR